MALGLRRSGNHDAVCKQLSHLLTQASDVLLKLAQKQQQERLVQRHLQQHQQLQRNHQRRAQELGQQDVDMAAPADEVMPGSQAQAPAEADQPTEIRPEAHAPAELQETVQETDLLGYKRSIVAVMSFAVRSQRNQRKLLPAALAAFALASGVVRPSDDQQQEHGQHRQQDQPQAQQQQQQPQPGELEYSLERHVRVLTAGHTVLATYRLCRSKASFFNQF